MAVSGISVMTDKEIYVRLRQSLPPFVVFPILSINQSFWTGVNIGNEEREMFENWLNENVSSWKIFDEKILFDSKLVILNYAIHFSNEIDANCFRLRFGELPETQMIKYIAYKLAVNLVVEP